MTLQRATPPLPMTLLIALLASCASAVPGPSPGDLTVTAAISAATLGDDCGSGEGDGARAPGLRESGDCAPDARGYCGYCRQSNVQIRFEASAGEGHAVIEVARVRLLDAESGAALETLTARSPRRWNGSAYVAWDGRLAAGSTERASYDLSAPQWHTHTGFARNAYSRIYRLEVVVRIDGVERTLLSGELTREPEVAT